MGRNRQGIVTRSRTSLRMASPLSNRSRSMQTAFKSGLHFAIVLTLGLLATPIWADDAKAEPNKSTWPRIQKKTYDFKEAAKEMEYGLFVPSTYDKTKKTPLIVALHGLSSNPQQIMRYPGSTELAEKHGYILTAPMGYNSQGWYGQKPPFVRKPDPDNLFELSEQDVVNWLALVRN